MVSTLHRRLSSRSSVPAGPCGLVVVQEKAAARGAEGEEAELGAKVTMPQSTGSSGEPVNPLAIVPASLAAVSPPPHREMKRTKKTEEDTEAATSRVKNLAGSFEEHRQAQ